MKFWLIDDDKDDRELFSRMLEEHFPEIECEAFARVPPKLNCDALFIDQCLGPVDGYDEVKRLRKEGYRIPIVVITGDPKFSLTQLGNVADGIAYKGLDASFYGSAKGMIRLIREHHHDRTQRKSSLYG